MITEIVILNIKATQSHAFEASFKQASILIAGAEGYIEHELLKCVENADQYLLIVRWNKLEDHTEGFRKSDPYQDWKKLLHHYYDPFPVVEHYQSI